MITLNGTARKVSLDSNTRRVTVELAGWRLWFGWRRKIKRGKRKGEDLPTSIVFSTEHIKRIRLKRASLFWNGVLIIDAPGANDHWTRTGRQRKHKIKFPARRTSELGRLLFGLDLLTAHGVVDEGWIEQIAAKHLPDRIAKAGKPTDDKPRRGERMMRMSQDPRAMAAAAPGSAERRPGPVPRQPTPPPLGPVPEQMRTAARAARRRRPAAGMPPA